MEKSNKPALGFYTRFRRKAVYARFSYLVDHECVFKILTNDDILLEALSVSLPEFAEELEPCEFFVQTRSAYQDFAQDALASGMVVDTGRTSPDKRRIPIWRLVN